MLVAVSFILKKSYILFNEMANYIVGLAEFKQKPNQNKKFAKSIREIF